MTCDVARKNDKIVICIWNGMVCEHIYYRDCKRDPMSQPDLIAWLNTLADKHGIRRSQIVIDDDGIGGGVTDHMPGCFAFVNGSKPIINNFLNNQPGTQTQNYANLKTQCTFNLVQAAERGEFAIRCKDPDVMQWISEELDQVRRDKPDSDAKIVLVGKDKIKERLGRSPDFADALMMRVALLLKPQPGIYF